jgi:hypothetical protein
VKWTELSGRPAVAASDSRSPAPINHPKLIRTRAKLPAFKTNEIFAALRPRALPH